MNGEDPIGEAEILRGLLAQAYSRESRLKEDLSWAVSCYRSLCSWLGETVGAETDHVGIPCARKVRVEFEIAEELLMRVSTAQKLKIFSTIADRLVVELGIKLAKHELPGVLRVPIRTRLPSPQEAQRWQGILDFNLPLDTTSPPVILPP